MKILHVGLCVDFKNEGLPFALKQASSFYRELKVGNEQSIIDEVNNHNFDIAFFQIQSPQGLSRPTVEHLRSKGVFTVEWSGDVRIGTPEFYLNRGVDLLLFSNERDVRNAISRKLKADFLQIGIDPKVFNKFKSSEQGNDIVYMGNNYRNQFPESRARAQMVEFLHNNYGNRFSVYGNGWDKATGENNADQLRQSKIYNNSKIGINFSQFCDQRYTSDRMFRILASGCFCLTHSYPGLDKDFENGKHLVAFRDLQELRRKIDYYLEHEDERKEIAENGYKLCHSTFTYKNMVYNLIKLVEKWRQ